MKPHVLMQGRCAELQMSLAKRVELVRAAQLYTVNFVDLHGTLSTAASNANTDHLTPRQAMSTQIAAAALACL